MRVFNLKKCKRIATLSFTPDGRQLAVATSGGEDHVGSVVWLDIVSGEPVQMIPLDVERCAIAPEHDKLAIAYSHYTRPGGASEVRWASLPVDGANPAWNDVRELPHRHIEALAFTPDGKRLAIGCRGQKTFNHPWVNAIHVAPVGRGKAVTIAVDELAGEVKFSPDGRWMVVTGGPGSDPMIRFHAYPAETRQADYTPKARRTRRVVFAPDRSELVALNGKQAILMLAGRSEPMAVMEGHTVHVIDAAFTPDGRRLFTASHDGTVRAWDAATGAAHKTFAWSVGKLTAVAVALDGLTAAAGGEKGQIVIWDVDA